MTDPRDDEPLDLTGFEQAFRHEVEERIAAGRRHGIDIADWVASDLAGPLACPECRGTHNHKMDCSRRVRVLEQVRLLHISVGPGLNAYGYGIEVVEP